MNGVELSWELERLERLPARAVQAFDIGDDDETSGCLATLGESLSELVDEVEAAGVES